MSVTPATASQDVRVTLNTGGMAMSFGSMGSGIATMEGKLRSVSDSTVSLSVTSLTRSGGDDERSSGQDVTVSRSSIASVERRQTSIPRSLLVAGALVGGSILVARAIGNGDQSGSATGGAGQTGRQ